MKVIARKDAGATVGAAVLGVGCDEAIHCVLNFDKRRPTGFGPSLGGANPPDRVATDSYLAGGPGRVTTRPVATT